MRTRLFILLAFIFVLLPIGIAFASPIARQSNANTAGIPQQFSQAVFYDNSDKTWWNIVSTGTSANLWHVIPKSGKKVQPLLQVSNSTWPKIIAYLQKQGVKI
jgi:hypothetical protein